jgi:hypothetical protein
MPIIMLNSLLIQIVILPTILNFVLQTEPVNKSDRGFISADKEKANNLFLVGR